MTDRIPWAEVSARAGRNDLPALLIRNWHHLPHEDRTKAVTDTWIMAEWPERAAPAELWSSLHGQIGFTVDGEPAAREDHLPEQVAIFRGAIPDRQHGMSWTLDPRTARWFAGRFDGMSEDRGSVFSTSVPRGAVMALNSGRGENEAVVDIEALHEATIEKLVTVAEPDKWTEVAP